MEVGDRDLRNSLDKVLGEVAQLRTTVKALEEQLSEDPDNDPTSKRHKFRLIVPSTSSVEVEGSATELIARRDLVIAFLVDLFGGATSSNATHGAYRANDGSVVFEQVLSVTSFCADAEFEMHNEAVVDKAHDFCTEWGQECIGLEIDGVLSYVEPVAPGRRRMSLVPPNNRSLLVQMHALDQPHRSVSKRSVVLDGCYGLTSSFDELDDESCDEREILH